MDLLCKCKYLPGAADSSPRLPSFVLPFSLALALSPGARQPCRYCCKQWSYGTEHGKCMGWHKAFCSKGRFMIWTLVATKRVVTPLNHRCRPPPPFTWSLHFSKIKYSIPARIGLPDFFVIVVIFLKENSLCQCLLENLVSKKEQNIGSMRVHISVLSSRPHFSILSTRILWSLCENAFLKFSHIFTMLKKNQPTWYKIYTHNTHGAIFIHYTLNVKKNSMLNFLEVIVLNPIFHLGAKNPNLHEFLVSW